MDTTLPMRTEMDWLICSAPLQYVQIVPDGTLEQYRQESAVMYGKIWIEGKERKGRDMRPFPFTKELVFHEPSTSVFLIVHA